MEVSHSLPGQIDARVKKPWYYSSTANITAHGWRLGLRILPKSLWLLENNLQWLPCCPWLFCASSSKFGLGALLFIMFSPLSFQEASLPPRVLSCCSVLDAGCFPVRHVNVFTLSMFDVPPMFEACCLASEINRWGRVMVSCGSLRSAGEHRQLNMA